jgi:hypothetical protein
VVVQEDPRRVEMTRRYEIFGPYSASPIGFGAAARDERCWTARRQRVVPWNDRRRSANDSLRFGTCGLTWPYHSPTTSRASWTASWCASRPGARHTLIGEALAWSWTLAPNGDVKVVTEGAKE